MKRLINRMIYHIMKLPRAAHYKKLKKRLTNSNFSIISSNCFGTFMYHNLNEKFNSPTINLFFSQNDFYQFVLHLKEYLETELVEITDDTVTYPIGGLTYNGYTVRINFMHYKSFEEAKSKWNERKHRIDFSNIYIIQLITTGITQEYLDKFAALPYKHKMLITHENNFKCDCMVTHKIFSKENYKPGEVLTYKSVFSKKRHMDDIDYISFLNEK